MSQKIKIKKWNILKIIFIVFLIALISITTNAIVKEIESNQETKCYSKELCRHKHQDLEFKISSKKIEINEHKIESILEKSDGIDIKFKAGKTKTKTSEKIRFIMQITKDYFIDEVPIRVEGYEWREDRLIFEDPKQYMDHLGALNPEEVREICSKSQDMNNYCKTIWNATYQIFYYSDGTYLSNKKVDSNGRYYNNIKTEEGYKITGLYGITYTELNDVIYSVDK
ncbi:hypothetical protein ACFL43_00290, partial [Thermodesulfobacteriota bacterium]